MFPEISIRFSGNLFRNYLAIALLALGLVLNWLYYLKRRSDSSLPFRKRLFLLRTVAIALLSFLLLGPVLRMGRVVHVKPSNIFMIDRSLSMTLPARAEDTGGASRIELVKERFLGGNLLDDLLSKTDASFFTFSGQPYPVTPDSIFEEGRERESGRTDIAGALKGALEKNPAADAVVVVTDGRINSGEDPLSLVSEDVPVIFIGVGEYAMSDDLDIAGIEAPQRVYEGSPIPFSVTLHSLVQETNTVTLKLSEGEALLKTKALELQAGELYRDVTFSLEGAEEGRHVYTIAVEGLEGERFVGNNVRRTVVEVLGTKKNVLVVSTSPGWDFSFFVKALQNLEYLSVDLFLLKPGDKDGIFMAGRETVPDRFSIEDLNLGGYDLLCLHGNIGDVSGLEFSTASKPFHRPGKGVVFLLTEGLPKTQLANNPVRDLLPRSFPASVDIVEGRFDVVPPTVDPTGLTRLLPNAERNLSVWSSLPPLTGRVGWDSGIVSGKEVVTLVSVKGVRNEEIPAVVAEDRAGFRVVSFLGKGFWRWSFHRSTHKETGYYYRKFVDSVIRWIFNGSGESEEIRLLPKKGLFLRGDDIEFLFKGSTGAGDRLYIVIGTKLEGASADTFTLGLNVPPDGMETLSIGPQRPGEYRFFYGIAGNDIIGEGNLHVDTYSKEFSNPQPDSRLLREIGAMEGGTYVDIEHVDNENMGQYIPLEKIDKFLVRVFVIKNNPILYLLVLICLITELFLRKMKGYS